ncbi:FMN-binding protein [Tepidicaulis sp.]|uniref:FMN-binding protein n=1 Tax=Tepidicaulis sp. TaxID=1920809 RepID=UPI003B5A7631
MSITGFFFKAAFRRLLAAALLCAGFSAPAGAEDVFLEPDVFLAEVFGGAEAVPEPDKLWLTDEVRAGAKAILDREMQGLRLSYWQDGPRTVWILEEIGKTRPITTGIAVNEGAIERVQILIYRESHGWEVRYPFFTDQFKGLRLDDEAELTGRIDGISGATLSVRAIRKLARLALWLDGHVQAEASGG